MTKTKENFLNYILSMGFIILIIIFLSSIVFISRYVLSNSDNVIENHVKITQIFLDDIKEVESITKSDNLSLNSNIENIDFFKVNYNDFIVSKPHIINLKDNTSIFTFYINGEIGNVDNTYYKKIKNLSVIDKKDIILYEESRVGIVLEVKHEEVKVLNEKNNIVEVTSFDKILGKVFFRN